MAKKHITQGGHAKRKFSERYGIDLNEELHNLLVKRIQQGVLAQFHCPQSNRVSIWLVDVEMRYVPGSNCDIKIPIVYDKERKQLVTALPESCVDINKIGMFDDECRI